MVPALAQITMQQNPSSNYTWYFPTNPPLPGGPQCLEGNPLGPSFPMLWTPCPQSVTAILSGPVTIVGRIGNTVGAAVNAYGQLSVVEPTAMIGTVPGTAPNNTAIVGAIYNSASPSPASGQTLPLQSDSSGRLIVNCATGCGGGSGGTSLTDEGTYTQGTTSFTPIGGYYNSSPASLSSGQGGAVQMTADRNLFVNLNKVGGNAVVTGGSNGSLGVGGLAATGAALTGNPVLVAGSDGTDARNLSTDTSGRPIIVGAAGSGSAVAGNPVLMAGSDGTDARTISTNSSGQQVVVGAGTAGSASGGVATIQGVASMTPVAISFGGTALVADPCQSNAKSNATVFQTSSGTLITGTSGKKNYICSLVIVTSAAAELSLVEYSGTCTGGTAFATLGSTTAADGLPLAANGGITLGSGEATVVSGAGNSNSGYNVCLLQSGTANVVAQATYVQQ